MKKICFFFLLLVFHYPSYSQCPDGTSAAITSHTSELCNTSCTGSATVTASGGTPAYTYSWAPSGGTKASASNLCAGNYTVTVTDSKGCTATASVAITEPTAISIVATNTPSHCGSCNGTATASASGGTSPYNYSWFPKGGAKANPTGLCAGPDTVTVTDANGCTATASTYIDNSNMTISITTSNIKCNGSCTGSALASVTGGNLPLSYAWSPSGGSNATATGLCASTYTIVVTDHQGCLAHAANTTITQPAAMSIAKYEVGATEAPCNGVAAVTVSGGTIAYTYLWSSGGQTKDTIKAQCPGIYALTITDANGCSETSSVMVADNSPLPITLTSFTATYIQQSNSVELAWTVATQLNNKEFIIEKTIDGITYENVAIVQGAGTTPFPKYYSVVDYNPTSGTSYYRLEQVDVDGNPTFFPPIFLSILNTPSTSALTMYPNPVNSCATLIYTAPDESPLPISIIDMYGRTVKSVTVNNIHTGENVIPINTSGLPPGIYLFHVPGDRQVYDLKFIKQ